MKLTANDFQRLQEAMDASRSVLTEGDITGILEQPTVQKEIADLVDYKNPTREMIPRKPGSSTAWLLNRRTAGATVGSFVSDTGEPTRDVSDYTRHSFAYKTLITRGRVTRKSQAEGQSYMDLLMNEIQAKVKDFRDYEDQQLIQADNGTNTDAFDGIWELIPAAQKLGASQVSGGADVTLNFMDQLVDLNLGNPDVILCTRLFKRQLASKLQAQQRFIDHTEIAGGFRVMTYNGIPVLPTTSIPNTIWNPASGAPTHANLVGGTGSTTAALCLDFDDLWIGELTKFTVEGLANVSSQYDEFDMYEDITVVLNNTQNISAGYGFTGSGY